MFEISLGIAIALILASIIASYLLKFELKRTGHESSIENTKLIALGMPPISSVKAGVIVPGNEESNTGKWSFLGKVYLFVVRAALLLAIMSIISGLVLELWFSA